MEITLDQALIEEKIEPIYNEEDLLYYIGKYRNRPVPGSGINRLIGKVLPQSWRPKARLLATNWMAPVQKRKARKFAKSNDTVKLNLGCGTLPLDGWCNMDLYGLPADVYWNITKKLPFKDNSVDAIFHEHVMEHIDAWDGYHFIKDSYRALKPGGILRIVMPDASRYISSYFDPQHKFMNKWRPGRPTPMIVLQEEFYGFSHKAIYDFETLELFCKIAGFKDIQQKSFGDSLIEPHPDCEWRITDSFYTEMVK